MKWFRWFIPAAAVFLLSGCFQISEVMHVNADGSGTVEETVLLSKKFVAQMNAMMAGFAGEGATGAPPPTQSFDLFDPAKLSEQAATMGEGVTYRSGKKIDNAEYSGFSATYAFTDINKLSLHQNASLAAPGGGAPSLPTVAFHFTKSSAGAPATLTVEQPTGVTQPAPPAPEFPAVTPESPAAAPESPAAAPDKEMLKMFSGLKVMLAIDVNGSIVSTNANYRDGNRITLIDMDMDKLGNSLPEMEKLSKLQTGSFGDAKEALKGVPGMKFDTNDKLSIVFGK